MTQIERSPARKTGHPTANGGQGMGIAAAGNRELDTSSQMPRQPVTARCRGAAVKHFNRVNSCC